MFFLFVFLVIGVCGVAPESVWSSKVGESVTLNTHFTKEQHDVILWHFNGIRIAVIAGEANKSCLYDGEGGRFRDRLEVDYESGSLTITHITAEHTGVYAAEIIRSKSSGTRESLNRNPKCNSAKVIPKTNNIGHTITTFNVSVSGVSSDAPESVSGKVGESVTLNTHLTKEQHDVILWYFNDIRIALIAGEANKSCLYDGEGGRFRDRLEVDYESGSLTITHITAEHTGVYEAQLIRSKSSGNRESLNRISKCDRTKITQINNNLGDTITTFNFSVSAVSDSWLSAEAVAGICACAAVLLVILVGYCIFFYRKKEGLQQVQQVES
uniref:uncharacterized protein LOC100327252 precursor n=1 Tax=Danio rerio TaxID=7955 RepID=UPI000163E2A3|nr:uncharacterized protein LOC100327252 precursor [Danio rerio]CAP71897.1 si:dkey-19a16.1 [Danio rerio]